MSEYKLNPIARISTPFKEKFGIPRQAGLITEATGRIEFLPPFDQPEALTGIEEFSHLWVSWIFHGVPQGKWQPMVRPPRLGGNVKKGVFATRSPFRPNSLGLSVVRLEAVQADADPPALLVSGVDMLDQTPIVDIKPYIPYSDSIADACGGFAVGAPEKRLSVVFSEEAEKRLRNRSDGNVVRQIILKMLQLDPRPAYKSGEDGEFGTRLFDFDLRWVVEGEVVRVTQLV